MMDQLNDSRIRRILALDGSDMPWREALQRLEQNDITLNRTSVGEHAIKSVQRLLVFLGYSTGIRGGFVIDGDYGRGTNRGVAQFQFEHGLETPATRQSLCYQCTFSSAPANIVAIPDTTFDVNTLNTLLDAALASIDASEILFRDFEEAIFHLNAVHTGTMLDCTEMMKRYGEVTNRVVMRLKKEKDLDVRGEWILAIIRQETEGIARPRFEQHKLSKANDKQPTGDFSELRIRSMSIGLGQIMGSNYKKVGASSAKAMMYSPLEEQILFVGRYIARKKDIVSKIEPTMEDFRGLARYYNGPSYEKQFYHERLRRWFDEFRSLA